LDEAKKGFSARNIREITFAIGGWQFQSVTFCNRLISFLPKPVFQHFPIVSCGLIIRLLGQHLDDIHHRKNQV